MPLVTISALNSVPLPYCQEIHFNSRNELEAIKRRLLVSIAELQQWLYDNQVECPPERRGDNIAELIIDGEWRMPAGKRTHNSYNLTKLTMPVKTKSIRKYLSVLACIIRHRHFKHVQNTGAIKFTRSAWPPISIIIPSFNQAAFLRQALDSIFSQNYPQVETIVLDPGSTDGSREILQEYAHKITRLILEPDNGQSDALQRGLNMASGEILTWLCSDDMLEPNSLFYFADAFMRYHCDIVVGGCRRIDEQDQELEVHFSAMPFNKVAGLDILDMLDVLHGWQAGHFYYQPEVFFTKNIWRRAGGFLHKSAYYGMDYDMWVRMALAGGTGVQICHCLAASRAQNNQKTQLGEEPVYLWQSLNFLKHYLRIVQLAEQSMPL